MGTLENRVSANRKINRAIRAAVKSDSRSRHDAFRLAALRAGCTVRPKFRFEILPRRLNIGEEFEKLEGADCASAHFRPRKEKLDA